MSGDSGIESTMSNFDDENEQLQQMQTFMAGQSRNQLNKEMVRSAAYFGFGERPEPVDLPNTPTKSPIFDDISNLVKATNNTKVPL